MTATHDILIQSILNSDAALTPTAGDKIFDLIIGEIHKGAKVNVDFNGIKYMTTAFLNAAIGQLYSQFTGEELNKILTLTNISKADTTLLGLVTERAKEYFKNKDDFEKGVNSSIDNI